MITCKECEHWDRIVPRHINGFCDCDKFIGEGGTSVNPPETLRYYTTSGCKAGVEFSTGEDFGCIHGKEKSNARD